MESDFIEKWVILNSKDSDVGDELSGSKKIYPESSSSISKSLMVDSKGDEVEINHMGRQKIAHQERWPDFIIFGLQEIVELEDKVMAARSIVRSSIEGRRPSENFKSSVAAEEWSRTIVKAVQKRAPKGCRYRIVKVSNMVGLCTIIVAKEDIFGELSVRDDERIMTGVGGRYGNKGALVTRLVIHSSTLCIINAHLSSGQEALSARESDLAKIFTGTRLASQSDHDSLILRGDGDGTRISEQEMCILFGDLNYRLSLERKSAEQQLSDISLDKYYDQIVRKYDQLDRTRRRIPRHPLRNFTEASITFKPTYKYDLNSEQFDSGEKSRVPSYCDRVLVRGPFAGGLEIKEYGSVQNQRRSDHRPVYAHLRIPVRTIDRDARASMSHSLSQILFPVRD
jgi:endonuclease/exonuclease/phosphatase family metal-dependent hydrolase